MLLLGVIIILNNKNSDVLGKINKINNLDNDIVLLQENYNVISEKQELIDNLVKENKKLNNDISILTNDIKNLNEKIAKYKK